MMPVRRQFGIAKAHGHLISRGALEQRRRRHIRHLPLEPAIDLGLVLDIPARKECGQRQLRIDDQVGARRLGFIHQRDHALDDGFAAIGPLDWAHLGGGDINSAHGKAFSVPLLGLHCINMVQLEDLVSRCCSGSLSVNS